MYFVFKRKVIEIKIFKSKFQEFETARILKIQKTRLNLDQNHHPKQTTMRKPTKKEGRKKKERVLEGCLLFSFLPFCRFSRGCLF